MVVFREWQTGIISRDLVDFNWISNWLEDTRILPSND